jgi:hypothetical protein
MDYVFSLHSRLFTYVCKKQCALAPSLVKVEYQEIVSARQEAL